MQNAQSHFLKYSHVTLPFGPRSTYPAFRLIVSVMLSTNVSLLKLILIGPGRLKQRGGQRPRLLTSLQSIRLPNLESQPSRTIIHDFMSRKAQTSDQWRSFSYQRDLHYEIVCSLFRTMTNNKSAFHVPCAITEIKA